MINPDEYFALFYPNKLIAERSYSPETKVGTVSAERLDGGCLLYYLRPTPGRKIKSEAPELE